MKKVAILGLGNVLRQDDAFGPSAVRRLESEWTFPGAVSLMDLGTPGLDLASYLVGHAVVLILDTATGQGPPGTIHVLHKADLLAGGGLTQRVTGHEGDLREAVAIADLAGAAPEHVVLVGVVPAALGDGTGLSHPVEAAVGPACRRAVSELRKLGVKARPRGDATTLPPWWERSRSAQG